MTVADSHPAYTGTRPKWAHVPIKSYFHTVVISESRIYKELWRTRVLSFLGIFRGLVPNDCLSGCQTIHGCWSPLSKMGWYPHVAFDLAHSSSEWLRRPNTVDFSWLQTENLKIRGPTGCSLESAHPCLPIHSHHKHPHATYRHTSTCVYTCHTLTNTEITWMNTRHT